MTYDLVDVSCLLRSAGPFGATRLLGMDVDLCALLTDPVILFLWSDQSLSYCCTVIKTVGLRSKV